MKIRMPLAYVKPFCMASALFGIFFAARGNWVVGVCMLMGSWLFERNLYRCPNCDQKLEMKLPLLKGARCPSCKGILKD